MSGPVEDQARIPMTMSCEVMGNCGPSVRKREMNAPPGAMAGLTGSQDHTLIPTLDVIIP